MPTPTPTWGPAPPGRLGSPEIFGYLPNWELNAQIDYGAITTVAYFGLGAGANGQLVRRGKNGSLTTEYSRWMSAKVTEAINRAHAAGSKFVLTVERMAWDEGGRAATRALLSSTEARTSLIADIVNEIAVRGVDGVSLDFEPILSDQRDNFAAFVGELRAALYVANPAYQLTFAATGSQPALTYQMIGNITASGAADAVIIMGYPLRAIDARYAGGLAPMYSATSYDLKQIATAYLNRVSADRIVMALPWYGRQWPTQTADLNSPTQTDRGLYDRPRNIGYVNALALAAQYGRKVDPVEQSAWTAFRWRARPACPETWLQVYYDDVETLGYKYDWALSKGFAGIGIWALGYDGVQPELWKQLRVKYRGLVDTSPPVGTVSLALDENLCQAPNVRLSLTADDGADGSGAVYLRLSNADATGIHGQLTHGRTYPAVGAITWPMDDADLGGSSAVGSRTIYAQWGDVAGNWSEPISTTFSMDLPATVAVGVGDRNGYTTTAAPVISVTHVSGRAVAKILVSSSAELAGGVLSQAVEAPLGTSSFSLINGATGGVDADGLRSVFVQSQDVAGCWSAPVAASVTLDRAAPTGSLSIVGGPTLTTDGLVSVLAPGTDGVSGLKSVQLSNDGQSWTAFAATPDPIEWSSQSTQDGTWTIRARWLDRAGNVSPIARTSLLLDRNGPTGTLQLDSGSTATNADFVLVDAPAVDATSGVARVALSNSPATSAGTLTFRALYAAGTSITWSLAGSGAPATVAEGPHTVFAQWQDTAGNWSIVASATIVVDRTAPQLGLPKPVLARGPQLGQTIVPVKVTASAIDRGAGIGSAAVEASRNNGAWARLADWSRLGSLLGLDPFASWRLRLVATDLAGNAATSKASASFTITPFDDRSSALVYGGKWLAASDSADYNGTLRYATAKGATATFSFTGRSVAWVAQTGPKRGRAKVFVDGTLVTTIDLQGETSQRQMVFTRSWSVSGKHTVRIRVLGTAGRPRVDVDAFVVLR